MSNIKVGDWVRFYQSGELVIGVVEYITKHDYDDDLTISTDNGVCQSDDILERRKKP